MSSWQWIIALITLTVKDKSNFFAFWNREKTVVTRGQSLDRKRKRKRNHSKNNNSQCTNSTHLNSVAAPSNLTTINVISNPGRLPGKGDYNHLERWLGDLETTTDNFDLPRISEVSESDTDADIESRVRKITTLQYHRPDILPESDSWLDTNV